MSHFETLKKNMQEIADIGNMISLINWDQEVNMPEKAASRRGQQLSTLSGIYHERFTSPQVGSLLEAAKSESGLSEAQKREIYWIQKDYDREGKLTKEFVTNKSRVISKAFMQWDKAKKAADFKMFQENLERVVDIVRQEAEIFGYKEHPYDALIDHYEAGMTVKQLDVLFEDVKANLKPLLEYIRNCKQHDDSFLNQKFPSKTQIELSEELLKSFGYDFKAGRQDISSHPFCTNFSSEDVRITTRIDENDLANCIWSTIHECGHALYEQGLPADGYGMPSGSAISLGIHESQSRFWENCIARSESFVKGYLQLFKEKFPQALQSVTEEQFYKGINVVKPSFIRTEADELTYHFHIMIRYEIEKAMVSGTLAVKDVRDMWNDMYQTYLGIQVPNDAQGVLQDVHWSHGGIGYFPTYSLGSFYAAQWWHFIQQEIPHAKQNIEQRNTADILHWLRKNIHAKGRLYTAEEVCVQNTGESLNFKYFMAYANEKYKNMYQ